MRTVLAYGGGVDSTAVLALVLAGEIARPDTVVFADPGAEFPETYPTVALARQRCEAAGIRFEIVRHPRETIVSWLARLGNVPVRPGAHHVCSLKFKGEVMQAWAERQFPGEPVNWLVGFEAGERRRTARFSPPPSAVHHASYPLAERGMCRADCAEVVRVYWGRPVHKSSCVFCPFMSACEIVALVGTPQWRMARAVERRFRETSPKKHQAWIDAGKPLHGKRAPAGMWRIDPWAEGARLFVARVDGRSLSTEEWEELAA